MIDTALMVCLREVMALFADQLEHVDATLAELIDRHGARRLVARTRMQAALNISVSHRITAWSRPITLLREELPQLRVALEVVQFGGPVGDRSSFGQGADDLATSFAAELGLRDPGHAWHTDRRRLVDLAEWMANTTSALDKLGTDVALMCQQGIEEVALRGGGKSSAIQHKTNPIPAELVQAAGNWNAALLAGLRQTQMHEQERSGSSWTMEWIVIPQMAEATSMALATSLRLCDQIERIGTP